MLKKIIKKLPRVLFNSYPLRNIREWLMAPIVDELKENLKEFNIYLNKDTKTHLEMTKYRSAQLSLFYRAIEESVKESYDMFKIEISKSMLFPPSFGPGHIERGNLLRYCIDRIKKELQIEGGEEYLFLSFGVFRGRSTNVIASELPEEVIYGFDTFTGLPEDWSGSTSLSNRFSLDGKLPNCNENVILIKGLIEDTLPSFISEKNNKIAFIHIDTDLYSTAESILKVVKERLVSGTIIVFDELIAYPGWKNGEYKALVEIFKRNEYEFIAFGGDNHTDVAIMIK